jgi:hypothetical protein
MISLEHFTGFNATELSATTIAGSPAYKIVFTVGDGKIEHLQVKTVVGNRGYVVGFNGLKNQYLADLPVAQKMINSLQINQTSSVQTNSGNG